MAIVVLGMAVVAAWGAWPPPPATTLQPAALSEEPGGALDRGELDALRRDCPTRLAYAAPDVRTTISGVTAVDFDPPTGFSRIDGLGEERRGVSGGILSGVGSVRTETALYASEDSHMVGGLIVVNATHGEHVNLCSMLRWAAALPQGGTAGTSEWIDRHAAPEGTGPAVPSRRPEQPAAAIVNIGTKTVLWFDESARPYRAVAWLEDTNLAVEVVAKGITAGELEHIVSTFRRVD